VEVAELVAMAAVAAVELLTVGPEMVVQMVELVSMVLTTR
jgi:hypothetical protein